MHQSVLVLEYCYKIGEIYFVVSWVHVMIIATNFSGTTAIQCPVGMSFQQCGPLCPQVCDAPATCISGCAEGCFCPTGQLTDSNGQCVAPQACGQLFTNVHCNYVYPFKWLL